MEHEMSHKAVSIALEFDMEAGSKLLNEARKNNQLYFHSISKDSKGTKLVEFHVFKSLSETDLRDLGGGYINIWDQCDGECVLDWKEAADITVMGDFAARKRRDNHDSIEFFLFSPDGFLGSISVYKESPGYMSADRVSVGAGVDVDHAICTYAVDYFDARHGQRCSFGIQVYGGTKDSARAEKLADKITKELVHLSVETVERDGSPLVLINQQENLHSAQSGVAI